jgi:2-methylisocitrate lyase-like PEP mutase family enzyme
MIAEDAKVIVDGENRAFNALWASSLTCSAVHGLPDAEVLPLEQRHCIVRQILACSSLPLIVDVETGGTPSEFASEVRALEQLGAAAVILEDKRHPKVNSLARGGKHRLECPERFADKLMAGMCVRRSSNFLVIARIESFIAGTGVQDAIRRAQCYIDAGVDGIMIHSNHHTPKEILEFAGRYFMLCERIGRRPALVAAPTTYNTILDSDLHGAGFSMVIHSNHLLLASYAAMCRVAENILHKGRSFEAGESIASVQQLLEHIEKKLNSEDIYRSNIDEISLG